MLRTLKNFVFKIYEKPLWKFLFAGSISHTLLINTNPSKWLFDG